MVSAVDRYRVLARAFEDAEAAVQRLRMPLTMEPVDPELPATALTGAAAVTRALEGVLDRLVDYISTAHGAIDPTIRSALIARLDGLPRELRSVSSRLGEAAATIRQDYADAARTRMVPPPDSQPESGKENPPLSEAWVRQQAAGSALLEVRRCPVREMARQFVLETSVTELGRQPDCGIRLDHPTVSRRHAEIRRDGDRFRIRDLGSRNGTYLNRLAVDLADLHNGDEITIGAYRLVFRDATSPHDELTSAHGRPERS